MFYVYVIESLKNKELYVGYTKDLKQRFEQHNQGLSSATKRYMPWKIVYYEACLEKEDATRRENYFKTSQGRKMLKFRIKKYLHKDLI